VLEHEGLELLDEATCLELMATVEVGRVGISVGALPAIFPVNFAMEGRNVYFRTGAGTKLSAATNHAVIAFQCDQFDRDEHTGWSVQGVGVAVDVTAPQELDRLTELLGQPWLDGDRQHVVRISLEMLTGRRIVDHGTRHPEQGGSRPVPPR
jgi:nitroimidazol reductase NimA-like FMN-containing flavoprotein (pyridoxamine 5'-phosphate oxidase superfamily)